MRKPHHYLFSIGGVNHDDYQLTWGRPTNRDICRVKWGANLTENHVLVGTEHDIDEWAWIEYGAWDLIDLHGRLFYSNDVV